VGIFPDLPTSGGGEIATAGRSAWGFLSPKIKPNPNPPAWNDKVDAAHNSVEGGAAVNFLTARIS